MHLLPYKSVSVPSARHATEILQPLGAKTFDDLGLLHLTLLEDAYRLQHDKADLGDREGMQRRFSHMPSGYLEALTLLAKHATFVEHDD
jgi:hypothetical protein